MASHFWSIKIFFCCVTFKAMEAMMIIFTALLPVAVLLFYIYHKDKVKPEPTSQLVKAFFIGTLSVPLSFCLSIPFGVMGLFPDEVMSIADSIRYSFFGAAIPEECAKLLVLWLLLRRNPYFDEKMDGIVYAVCVSMGFAAVENIIYLFNNYETFLSVGIVRALFAVPGHFCFGVLMGYYYSMVKFYPKAPQKNVALVLLAPIIVHGIYDSILFAMSAVPLLSGILALAFLFFCLKMWKYGSERIREHRDRDENS